MKVKTSPRYLMAALAAMSVGGMSPASANPHQLKNVSVTSGTQTKAQFPLRFVSGKEYSRRYSTRWPYSGKNRAQRARLQSAFSSM